MLLCTRCLMMMQNWFEVAAQLYKQSQKSIILNETQVFYFGTTYSRFNNKHYYYYYYCYYFDNYLFKIMWNKWGIRSKEELGKYKHICMQLLILFLINIGKYF